MPSEFFQPGNIIPLVGLSVSAVAIAGSIAWGAARSRERTREREAARRRVAAAVAEGTMKADEGERILSGAGASGRRRGCGCWRR